MNDLYLIFTSYSLKGDETKSTSTETGPVVSMLLSLHEEIQCKEAHLISRPVILNGKSRTISKNMISPNIIKSETNLRTTSSYLLKWILEGFQLWPKTEIDSIIRKLWNGKKKKILFQTYYFLLSHMSFLVLLIPELHS